MTKEEKDLLIKDLCARVPYGVKVEYDNQVKEVQYIEAVYNEVKLLDPAMNYTVDISDIKLYLFPLSSMTDEQKKEFDQLLELELKAINDEINHTQAAEFEVDFYHKNHFDWRGLIPMGLATDATGKNIY